MVSIKVAGATAIGTTGHRIRPRRGNRSGTDIKSMKRRHSEIATIPITEQPAHILRVLAPFRFRIAASSPPQLPCAHVDCGGPLFRCLPDSDWRCLSAWSGAKSGARRGTSLARSVTDNHGPSGRDYSHAGTAFGDAGGP